MSSNPPLAHRGSNPPVLQPGKLRPGSSPGVEGLVPSLRLFSPLSELKSLGLGFWEARANEELCGKRAARRPQGLRLIWDVPHVKMGRQPQWASLHTSQGVCRWPQAQGYLRTTSSKLPTDFKLSCPHLLQTEGNAFYNLLTATLIMTDCLLGIRCCLAPHMFISLTLYTAL